MPTYLHLLPVDGPSTPLAVIAAQARQDAARVIVVLTGDGPPPPVPAGVTVHRLGPGALDHAALLDLIFACDHVVAW